MYLSYYNLKTKPFQMSTDPGFLWLGEKHKEALAVLKYAIMENKGVLALTGDVGTGKTTLINALLKSLGNDTVTATIYDARLEVLDFFNTVAAAFKIKGTFDGKGKFILRFMDFLIKAHERKQKVLLIIDEAQGINADLLEEIRLLSNLEAEYTRLLNIFFVGQNEFIDILQKYENRALRQRVTIRYHIDPLTLNETAAYIQHRLKLSGTTAPIFDSGAIDEIYFFSGGYPRLINIMCDHALLTGYVREIRTINANHIRECREELLVSKKTSEKDFEARSGFQQGFYGEPMAPESSKAPIPPEPSREPKPPDPSKEQMAPDLSREIMDYVKDSRFSEDDQDTFGQRYSMPKPAVQRKIQKKRSLKFRSVMIFLLIAGAGAAYVFYGTPHSKRASFVTTKQQPFKKFFSMNAKSKNDASSSTQVQPNASEIPKPVRSEIPKDSRSPILNTSNSGISDTLAQKKTESYQPDSSRTFSQNAEAAAFSKKLEETKPVVKTPVMKTDKSSSLDRIPEAPLDAGSPKEGARITSGDSGGAPPDLSSKTNTETLTSKKSPRKIQSPVQTPAKMPLKSSTVAAGSQQLPAKTPVIFQKPAIKKENVRTASAEPPQTHNIPRNTKSLEKADVNTSMEKSGVAESITRSDQKPNKLKKSETLTQEKPKKELVVASSVSPDNQTKTLFERFKKNLEKKTTASEAGKPAKPLTTIKERAPAAASASDQKKPMDQKAENRAETGTGEKIASLDSATKKSEKGSKTHSTYIPLMTRLKSFLTQYCRSYERKDLNKFSDFFTVNAIEKGKPFKTWLPTYRRNFKRIDSIEYNIDLKRFATQEETGWVKIDGTFHIRARLEGSKDWLKSSGDISMVLEANGNSFKVQQLDY